MKTTAFALLLGVLLSGCATHHVHYDAVQGESANSTYTLKESCYVFRYNQDKRSIPFVGGVLLDVGARSGGLPRVVSETYNGRQFGDKVILGVLPEGMEFKIETIKTESNFETGPMKSPIIRPLGPTQQKWPLLDATWISDRLYPERIHPAYLK